MNKGIEIKIRLDSEGALKVDLNGEDAPDRTGMVLIALTECLDLMIKKGFNCRGDRVRFIRRFYECICKQNGFWNYITYGDVFLLPSCVICTLALFVILGGLL